MAAPINLAGLFLSISRPDEAVAASRRAVEIDSGSPVAFGYLGNALQAQGDIAGAIAAYRRTLELYPAEAAVHSNLVYALNFDPSYDAPTIFAEHLAWSARHAEPQRAARLRLVVGERLTDQAGCQASQGAEQNGAGQKLPPVETASTLAVVHHAPLLRSSSAANRRN